MEGEGAKSHELDLRLGLSDQHAVHHLLAVFAHAGVAMSAEDGRDLRESLRHFAVFLIAEVGEQEDGIAVAQLVKVLGQHFLERHEMRAIGMFGVEVGQAVLAQLDTSYHADFQSVALEDGVRMHIGHLQRVVKGDVGAHKGEFGPR